MVAKRTAGIEDLVTTGGVEATPAVDDGHHIGGRFLHHHLGHDRADFLDRAGFRTPPTANGLPRF